MKMSDPSKIVSKEKLINRVIQEKDEINSRYKYMCEWVEFKHEGSLYIA